MVCEYYYTGRDVTKVGVVITDGKSSNVSRTANEARMARQEGVHVLAIGVGSQYFQQELNNIASSAASVFTAQNITDLTDNITAAIHNVICPSGKSINTSVFTAQNISDLTDTITAAIYDVICPSGKSIVTSVFTAQNISDLIDTITAAIYDVICPPGRSINTSVFTAQNISDLTDTITVAIYDVICPPGKSINTSVFTAQNISDLTDTITAVIYDVICPSDLTDTITAAIHDVICPSGKSIVTSVFSAKNITDLTDTITAAIFDIICPSATTDDTYYYIPMDEIEDGVIVNPSGLTPQISGIPVLVPGVLGSALELNTSSDFLRVTGANSNTCFGNLDSCSNGFTIAVWVNFNGFGGTQNVLISNGATTSHSNGISMLYTNGRMQWIFRMKTGRTWSVSGNNILSGRWYHVVVTWSLANGLTLYIDGREVAGIVESVLSTEALISHNNVSIIKSIAYTSPNFKRPSSSVPSLNEFQIGQSNHSVMSHDSSVLTVDEFQFWSMILMYDQLREMGAIYTIYLPMDQIHNGELISYGVETTMIGNVRLSSGKIGNALDLSGSGEYIHLGNFANSCLGNTSLCMYGFTVAFWLNIKTLPQNGYIISTGSNGISIYLNQLSLFVAVQNGDYQWMTSVSDLAEGLWYFIEVTWTETSGVSLFIDQTFVASSNNGVYVTSTPSPFQLFYIGLGNSDDVENYAAVQIDDLTVYNAQRELLLALDFIIRGDVQLVAGKVGQALKITGTGTAKLSPGTGCYGNLDFCRHGFLLSLWINFLELQNSMTYLSSDKNGIRVDFYDGNLRITVETSTRWWQIVTSSIHVNTWYNVEVTWTDEFGLKLYLNNKLVAYQPLAEDKIDGSTNITASNAFKFGQSSTGSSAIFDEMEFWEASHQTSPPTTHAPHTGAPVVTTPDADGLSGGSDNAFDCPDCMIVGGHGFWSHPTSCNKYLEITEDVEGNRIYTVRKCRDGLFWDQYVTTCRLPENVNCANDPCKTLPIISYDVKDVCSAYVLCAGGRSVRACCPNRERYVAGQGCVTDPTCTDTCGETDDTHLISPQECDKRAHPTDADYYIQSPGEGHGDIVRRCAPGTLFNEASCMCDILDTSPQTDSLAGCNPTGNFTFDSNQGGNFAHDNVVFANGEALYNGAGYINLYRFANDDFGEKLVIRIKATPSSQGSVLHALLTNCVDAVGQRFSLAIILYRLFPYISGSVLHALLTNCVDAVGQRFSLVIILYRLFPYISGSVLQALFTNCVDAVGQRFSLAILLYRLFPYISGSVLQALFTNCVDAVGQRFSLAILLYRLFPYISGSVLQALFTNCVDAVGQRFRLAFLLYRLFPYISGSVLQALFTNCVDAVGQRFSLVILLYRLFPYISGSVLQALFTNCVDAVGQRFSLAILLYRLFPYISGSVLQALFTNCVDAVGQRFSLVILLYRLFPYISGSVLQALFTNCVDAVGQRFSLVIILYRLFPYISGSVLQALFTNCVDAVGQRFSLAYLLYRLFPYISGSVLQALFTNCVDAVGQRFSLAILLYQLFPYISGSVLQALFTNCVDAVGQRFSLAIILYRLFPYISGSVLQALFTNCVDAVGQRFSLAILLNRLFPYISGRVLQALFTNCVDAVVQRFSLAILLNRLFPYISGRVLQALFTNCVDAALFTNCVDAVGQRFSLAILLYRLFPYISGSVLQALFTNCVDAVGQRFSLAILLNRLFPYISGSVLQALFTNCVDAVGQRFSLAILLYRLFPYISGSVLQALFTNCVDAVGQRFSLAILLERFNGNNVVFFTETDLADGSTPTTMRTIRVPYTPDAVNEIIYIYDGSYLTGVVNGVKIQAALRGNILMRRSGLVIGAGSDLDYYTGSVDEVQIYKDCYPSYAEAERTP
ncbi:PIF-like protein [Mya arenaria]|uniref:PIF-like protein n=1 Tax=Mya arenaria TaxID=6604 RepID=A0ABY7G534_MYAAR|nr:PIF-like protein [Mya arenaria]